jgi:hypothetical protein
VLAVCVLSGGYIVGSDDLTPFVDEPMTVDIQNEGNTTYRVTASRVPVDGISDLTFRYDTENRTRYTGLGEVATSTNYRNLAVLDADRSTDGIVTAGDSTSLTLDSADGGSTYVVIVETADNRSVWTMAEHCTDDGAEFHITISDGLGSSSVSCS